MTNKLILASASPARLELLQAAGLAPDAVIPADVDETPLKNEKPEDYVLRVARMKAQAIAQLLSSPRLRGEAGGGHSSAPAPTLPSPASGRGYYILAADTAASMGRSIIGKADDAEHARKIIRRFSGRRHRVHTGLCVITPQGAECTRRVTTIVKFGHIAEAELEAYIAGGTWQGKAGAFGIQGTGGSYIEWIRGSVSNVIGLPLVETRNLLKGLGYSKAFSPSP